MLADEYSKDVIKRQEIMGEKFMLKIKQQQEQYARDLKVADKKAKEAAHDATKDAVEAANRRARDALILAYEARAMMDQQKREATEAGTVQITSVNTEVITPYDEQAATSGKYFG